MSIAKYITASEALGQWRDKLESGEKPRFYPLGTGELERIEIGPGNIVMAGGMPGAGKTALVMQCVCHALIATQTLRAIVCNVEMSPSVLLDRQLSRISGIDLDTIRYRDFTEGHSERIDAALQVMDTFIDRLCFVRPPFDLSNVAATVDAFTGGNCDDVLLVLDYIQRIKPPGDYGDKRGSVDASMSYLREFADAGAAVMVVAAVGRQKDSRGRTSYDGDSLNLASFRESSELEFGCDDAFILATEPGSQTRILKHLKARNTEPKDIALHFDGATQSFTCVDMPTKPTRQAREKKSELDKSLANLWNADVPVAGCDEEDDE
jgi:replicative DNA helicase